MKHALQRRHFSTALAGLALHVGAGMSSALSPAWAQESSLPIPDSLQDAAAAAARQDQPLVLLISLRGCPYCELVRRNYLLPALADGLHAWQINMQDKTRSLVGFDGQSSTAADQIARWKIRLAPTVLFLSPQGLPLAERLVGVASVDFYGAYLDQRLATSKQTLKSAPKPRS
jgi:thioredoxin-related protein